MSSVLCRLSLGFLAAVALAQSPEAVAPDASSAASPSCATPPPQASGYCLAFSTNFNPINLSPNSLGSYSWYNPGIPGEASAPYGNIFVRNGRLNLVWTRGQATPDTSISTAAQNGSHYLGWHYGYFEVRMRWDTVAGAWPAIWMIPVQNITKPSEEQGELDIFEGQGITPGVFYGTIHDWKNNQDIANNNCCDAYQVPSTTDMSQFHTYGVLWVPGHVVWYLDNRPVISAATYPIFDDVQQKYFLIVGSQEGANWTYGDMSGVSATSISMQVDWVRVWQQTANGCPAGVLDSGTQ
jgi:hypothetical protein